MNASGAQSTTPPTLDPAGISYSIKPDVRGSFNNQASANVAGAVANAASPVPVKPDPSIVRSAVLPPYTGLDEAALGVMSTDELQLVISTVSKIPSLSSSKSNASATLSPSESKQPFINVLVALL